MLEGHAHILEKILDEISFEAPDKGGEKIKIDKAYVDKHLGDIAKERIYPNLFYNLKAKLISNSSLKIL